MVRLAALFAAVLLALPIAAEAPAPSQGGAASPASIPASRQADEVAVITIEGVIDRITVYSVKRRLEAAQRLGAGAVVFEIDSPGGEVGAVLEICSLIKNSPVANTVAWVNTDAYSGGAIVALACREIVVAEYASFGDAAPVTIVPIPETERQKQLSPLLAEVVDSARRRGYDEKLVQALVSLGVELWLVRHRETGRLVFVDENEHRELFGEAPPASSRATVQSGGAVPPGLADGERKDSVGRWITDQMARESAERAPQLEEEVARARERTAPLPVERAGEDTRFLPAGDQMTETLIEQVDLALDLPSSRPDFRAEDGADWELVEYATDGRTLLVLKTNVLLRYGLAQAVVRDDGELLAFFGAQSLVRLDRSWSEALVVLLSGTLVRGVLIAVFLLAMFIELSAPGIGLGGAVAGGALIALLAPPLLIGAAGWWTVVAIVLGVLLILLELLIFPGLTVAGIAGIVSLMAGLVGTFVTDSPGQLSSDIATGVATTLLAFFVAGIGMYFFAKFYGSLPIVNRLVLGAQGGGDEEGRGMLAAMGAPAPESIVRVGDEGVAMTRLHPAGSAEFGGRLVDVVCEYGYADRGDRVRVLSATRYRVAVERLDPGAEEGAQA